jgi:hypothetical protein
MMTQQTNVIRWRSALEPPERVFMRVVRVDPTNPSQARHGNGGRPETRADRLIQGRDTHSPCKGRFDQVDILQHDISLLFVSRSLFDLAAKLLVLLIIEPIDLLTGKHRYLPLRGKTGPMRLPFVCDWRREDSAMADIEYRQKEIAAMLRPRVDGAFRARGPRDGSVDHKAL